MRHVFVLLANGLRADCLEASGSSGGFLDFYQVRNLLSTRNLDQVMDRGVRFESARSSGTDALPSLATLLTGCHPPRHGVRCPCHPLSPGVETLWTVFARAGYRTTGANLPEGSELLGLAKGCEREFYGNDAELFASLAREPDRPHFVVANFTDISTPFLHSEEPPEKGYLDEYLREVQSLARRYSIEIRATPDITEDGDRMADIWRVLESNFFSRGLAHPVESQVPLYAKGIRKFDEGRFRHFWSLFEASPFAKDAVVVLTSLFGKAIYRPTHSPSDLFVHGCPVVESAVTVPLAILADDLPAGARIPVGVGHVDLAPTIAELTGVDWPVDRGHGRSLLELARSGEGFDRPGYMEHSVVFLETTFSNFIRRGLDTGRLDPHQCLVHSRALTSGRYKYVEMGDQLRRTDLDVSNPEFVETLYHRLLGRPTPAEERDAFRSRLDSGELDRRGVLQFMLRQAKLENRYRLHDLMSAAGESVNLLALDEERFAPLASRLQETLIRLTLDLQDSAPLDDLAVPISPTAPTAPTGPSS